jgi:peptidoglycan-associated lipoprotein
MKNIEQLMILVLTSFALAGCCSNKTTPSPISTPVHEAETKGDESSYAKFKKIAGNKIYFTFDSYALSKEARKILEKQAEWLKANPNTIADIEGHCDEIGTDEYNFTLGLKRAQSVKNFIEQRGVDKERLSVTSFGKTKADKYGHTKYVHRANRRAVTVVIK